MLARIINCGYRNRFPTHLGDLHIPRGTSIDLRDQKALKELQHYRDLQIDMIEPAGPPIDYSKYPINQLRRIAKNQGIEKSFFLKKSELIAELNKKSEM